MKGRHYIQEKDTLANDTKSNILLTILPKVMVLKMPYKCNYKEFHCIGCHSDNR